MKKYGDLDFLIKDYVQIVTKEAHTGVENDPVFSDDYKIGYRMGLSMSLKFLKIILENVDDGKAFGLDFDIEKEVEGIDVDKLVEQR